MAHVIRHNNSNAALQSLLKLIEYHLPPGTPFPATKYLFMQCLSEPDASFECHAYCPRKGCDSAYIGTETKTCFECHTVVDYDDCVKGGHYFLKFSLTKQLIQLMEKHKLNDHLLVGEKRQMCDAFQGRRYRDMALEMGENDITVSFSADGVPIHRTGAKQSITPVTYMVNELPYAIRRKNTCLAILWFGKLKPNMNTVLTPFVDELNNLSRSGFTWRDSGNNQITSRVTVTTFTCDSIQRCTVQNVKQFNGQYGCTWCLAAGEMVKVSENGFSRIYPFEEMAELRNADDHRRSAEIALRRQKPHKGVKGPSVLMLLTNFCMINSFVVDSMHCVFLGVVRFMTCLWLDTPGENYHISGSLRILNERLLSIKPPSEISRLPSNLNHRKTWKASEWRSWLLHYSGFVVKGILNRVYYEHWMLLVCAMHILSAERYGNGDLDLAESLLLHFVSEFETLYGRKNCRYNVHQLTHIVQCCRDWGPFWSFSTFPFESFYSQLGNLFHGTQYVHLQIARKFSMIRRLPYLARLAFQEDSCMKDYFLENICGFMSFGQKFDDITSVGLPINFNLTDEQKDSTSRIVGFEVQRFVKAYKRLNKRPGMSIVSNYLKHGATERNDWHVILKDGYVAFVGFIFSVCMENCGIIGICDCSKQLFLAVKRISKIRPSFSTTTDLYAIKSSFIGTVGERDHQWSIHSLDDVAGKCVYMEIGGKSCVSIVPCFLERD